MSYDVYSDIEKEVQLYEFGPLIDKSVYFPIATGTLISNAKNSDLITNTYQFNEIEFIKQDFSYFVDKLVNPFLVGFSASLWNDRYNLDLAKEIKNKFPNVIIVFGGYNIEINNITYLEKYDFIDVLFFGSAEKSFSMFLESLTFVPAGSSSKIKEDFLSGVPNIAYRDKDNKILKTDLLWETVSDLLDEQTSPYLDGTFDNIIKSSEYKDWKFQMIFETNRGCPYKCTFCAWGVGFLSKKVKNFSLERVEDIIKWASENKIEFMCNADANFGIFERDVEISKLLVKYKKLNGYPEKCVFTWAKNATDRLEKIARILYESDSIKNVVLALQTTTEGVLENIRRDNIGFKHYFDLYKKIKDIGVAVSTDIIVGLPGETYNSFKINIDTLINEAYDINMRIYQCAIFTNTEMFDKSYIDKFEIKTKKNKLSVAHVHDSDEFEETVDIIVEHDTMTVSDYKKMVVFGYVTQALHTSKLAVHVMYHLHTEYDINYGDFLEFFSDKKFNTNKNEFISNQIDKLISSVNSTVDDGNENCEVHTNYESMLWNRYELWYIDVILGNKEKFYNELLAVTVEFLKSNKINFNKKILLETFKYQQSVIPDYKNKDEHEFNNMEDFIRWNVLYNMQTT
jgi:putative methyltransferase